MDRPATLACLADPTLPGPAMGALAIDAVRSGVGLTTLRCDGAAVVILQGDRRAVLRLARAIRRQTTIRLVGRWTRDLAPRLMTAPEAPAITSSETTWLRTQLAVARPGASLILALAGWARLRAAEARLAQMPVQHLGVFPNAAANDA